MAVTKQISTTSLSIEVQSGIDQAGDPKFSKKNFSNIRTDVAPENAYAVAEAIIGVLSVNTRSILLNESSSLDQV
jgi:hypothetical protein